MRPSRDGSLRGDKPRRGKMAKIPDTFVLSGETTDQHVMLGEPKNPAHCAERLSIADAWNTKFGHYPKAVYVDRERIKVKDQDKWWWGPPTEDMIKNLTALDNGRRHACTAHKWEVSIIKKADVVRMSEETKESLKDYAKNRRSPKEREPTVRRRINGLTRMIPRSVAR
jgi:hypothetical protein